MSSKQGLIKQAGNAMKKASPTILTCLGAIGVVVTAVLAVKATPKAMEMVKADSRKRIGWKKPGFVGNLHQSLLLKRAAKLWKSILGSVRAQGYLRGM